MRVFKLTDANYETFNNTKWGKGVEHRLPHKDNPRLCTDDVFHFHRNMNLGLLLNPMQGNFSPLVIWEADAEIVVEDWGKAGGFACRTLRIIPTPEWYSNKKQKARVYVQFAVLCAEAVLPVFEERFPEDRRPRDAVDAAKAWLANPTERGVKTAVRFASHAITDAAAYAAAAPDATSAVDAAYYAANAAAYAIHAAVFYVAHDAATAAVNAAYAVDDINFAGLADQAVEMTRKGDNNE